MTKFYPKWRTLKLHGCEARVMQATLHTRVKGNEHRLQLKVEPGQDIRQDIELMMESLRKIWELDVPPPLAKQYSDAMIDGDHARCIRIEEAHGLYGLPPELVSLGLAAIDRGEDLAGVLGQAMGSEQ